MTTENWITVAGLAASAIISAAGLYLAPKLAIRAALRSRMTIKGPNNNAFFRFAERQPEVLKAIDQIAVGFTNLFTAVTKPESSVETETLFLLSSAIYTEYEEIVTLATSDYGFGATKLLRALYERIATTLYLMKNPGKVMQFKEYSDVHWYKLLAEADRNGTGKQLSDDRRKEIMSNLEAVRARFSSYACDKCKDKEELRGSWTRLPPPDQASQLHEQLRLLSFHGYLMPTFFLHTTDWGISRQLVHYVDGTKMFRHPALERDYAEKAIVVASNLMRFFAAGFSEFFKLNLDKECANIQQAIDSIGNELRPAP